VILGRSFEAADEPFRQLAAGILVRRVAVVNTAPERTRIPCGAAPVVILPGASLAPIERALGPGCRAQQEVDFGGRDEERVSVLLEPAAAAAQFTDRTETSHLGIELLVQSNELGAPCGLGTGQGRTWMISHFGVFEIDDKISSTTFPTEVRGAYFAAQVNGKSDFMSISLLTLARRTSTFKHPR